MFIICNEIAFLKIEYSLIGIVKAINLPEEKKYDVEF